MGQWQKAMYCVGFTGVSVVKNLSAKQETQEITLEKEMATHSSILAWRIPWTEEPGGTYSPWGHKALDTTEREPLSSTKK